MRLARIYQPGSFKEGEIIDLSRQASHHLAHVLRTRIGDECIVFDGQAGEFRASILTQEKNRTTIQLDRYDSISRESSLELTLGQAILRPGKMDYVLQKAVELGVSRIIPLLTEHCSVKLTPDRSEKRKNHWQKIIIAACEQSGRTRLPYLENPLSLQEGIQKIQGSQSIIFHPYATQKMQQFSVETSLKFTLLVGPEGGWSEQELELALDKGSIPVQLGPRILRTETASLATIIALQTLIGDI